MRCSRSSEVRGKGGLCRRRISALSVASARYCRYVSAGTARVLHRNDAHLPALCQIPDQGHSPFLCWFWRPPSCPARGFGSQSSAKAVCHSASGRPHQSKNSPPPPPLRHEARRQKPLALYAAANGREIWPGQAANHPRRPCVAASKKENRHAQLRRPDSHPAATSRKKASARTRTSRAFPGPLPVRGALRRYRRPAGR